ncbi:hypothetical protein [Pseudoteredinibacter isoporae]|uniref:Uncharacterized protein n=1 Tax=Pseudoteredinibacter isoporae TaxID=570281 RepID=A0A7X0JUN0_9GAMM|nr:hypothetical protein [Pseudoteredinibacter isoporae]MBB6522487.1 hypothetical protein [Pseudoteredinibacter isoporae]NHO88016.1 hypothetical protein [Pseudoteredinibacter isoporae]NIB23653.1 hypothetical protein [Pseudoteredinibacter isoporae]
MSKIFVDRRKGVDRRLEHDRCKDLPLDLFHRKRRKSSDRRAPGRTLSEDYFAFMEANTTPQEPCRATASEFPANLSNDVTTEDDKALLN